MNMSLETESIGSESPDAVCLQDWLKQQQQQQSQGGMMMVKGHGRGCHLIHSTQTPVTLPTLSSLALAKVSTLAATFSYHEN